jgi:hypothetical protein
MTDPLFYARPGMSRASTLHLDSQVATILGTDAVARDLPFGVMARKFQQTGDKQVLRDGHEARPRRRQAFIVRQMTNLGALPPARSHGRGFFPLKLAGCGAAPASASCGPPFGARRSVSEGISPKHAL